MNGAARGFPDSWVEEGCRLLDLGCGEGGLLESLARERKVAGIGIEIDERLVAACIGKGLEVVNADIESGLDIFGDKSFDCAVLSQTLQEMRDPTNVLREMLRVSRRSVVSITNAGHWSKRLTFLSGRVPTDEGVDRHGIHRLITVADFESLCDHSGMRIIERRYLNREGRGTGPLRAVTAAYLLEAGR